MSAEIPLWPFVREVDQRAGALASELPLLSVSQVHGVRRYTELFDKEPRAEDHANYKLATSGDVIVNRMSADKGALGIAFEAGLVSPDYVVLRTSNRIDARYVAYVLKSAVGQSHIRSELRGIGTAAGANVRTPRISTSSLLRLRVHRSSGGGRQIADYLDHETAEIDAFIADLRSSRELILARQEADLATRIRANSSPATTRERRGSFNAPEHDFGQGWIPLGSVARVSTGFGDTQDAAPDGAYPFFVRSDTVERIDNYTFDTEAVLTAGDGAGVGKVFHHYRGKFAAHQRVYVIEPTLAVSGRFLYWALRTFFGGIVLAGTAKSTVESLRRPMLTGFPLPALELAAQLQLAAEADHLEAHVMDQLADIDAAISLAKERRASLITVAVTGQIDVTAKQVPAVDSIQTAIEESR